MSNSSSTFLSQDEEPIVALATGSLPSPVATLRISGHGCFAIVSKFLSSKQPIQSHTAFLCDFLDHELEKPLDQIIAIFYQNPRSYTGQDSIELSFHGSPYVIGKALSILAKAGIRHAEAGEFTRRAFLSGKIDLTKAEGIHALISSSSQQQWAAASELTSGKLKQAILDLHKGLMEAMAWVEASIDFPDEKETAAVGRPEIQSRVDHVHQMLSKLERSYVDGRIASQGLSVAIIGEPNAGKSTLLNQLLGYERAIVTPIAGTTRDYLEESCLLKGRLFRLIDTAGLRQSQDQIEALGIQRSMALAKEADVVIVVVSSQESASAEAKLQKWKQDLSLSAYLPVLSKCDLEHSSPQKSSEHSWIEISCQNDMGIEDLINVLIKQVDTHTFLTQNSAFITTQRHLHAVQNALASLDSFYASLKNNAFEELLAFELRQAALHLSSIVGKIDADDILGVVFSSFCVGK